MNEHDGAVGSDAAKLAVHHNTSDKANWHCHAKLEKFHGVGKNRESTPYEVIEDEGNLLCNAGINLMQDLLVGDGGTVYSNTNAAIAVGTSATAANATDTTLTAENDRKGMEATYPLTAAQVATFRSVFDDSGSDGVWAEWGIFNNTVSGGDMLNHKVTAFGTKSGGSWQLTVTITIS